LIQPDEIYLASFPFGDIAGMKLRPVLTLTGPLGSVPEVLVSYSNRRASIDQFEDQIGAQIAQVGDASHKRGRAASRQIAIHDTS
jgi:hypothetical protein